MKSPIKKIEELVCKGMVLDEHGKWIPIAEKIRKEKEFLNHLEKGEILQNGLWVKMSDIAGRTKGAEMTNHISTYDQTAVADKEAVEMESLVPEETRQISFETELPEETVSLSIETLSDVSPDASPSVETTDDFPPETKIFSVEKGHEYVPQSNVKEESIGKSGSMPNKRGLDVRKQAPAIEEIYTLPPETEFDETVICTADMLREYNKEEEVSKTEDSSNGSLCMPTLQFKNNHDSGLRRKHFAAIATVVVVTIFVMATILKLIL